MTEKAVSGKSAKKASSGRAANPPTGTVTFLFTDIEGSTSMWENHPRQMEAALKRHDEILRENVEAHQGYVFKMIGDACCAAFATAKDGLQAILAAQRALRDEEWPENVKVRARAALHTGVAEEREGDYFGPPVNRVARLMGTGHGGQVLVSDATYNLVRDHLVHLEPGAELRYLGEHRLRDLRYTERIFQLVVPDLKEDFPALKTHGVVTPAQGTTGPQEGAGPSSGEDRYSRKGALGSGGMAEVYLARDEVLDRDVALKVLSRQYADDEQFIERFEREAKSAAALSHPNIVSIYDRGKTKDGSYYMVMECVTGGTLKALVLQEGPLPARTALELTLQIAQALEAAHEEGIVHRDIKPQNVLLSRRGQAKVADFGIAKAASWTSSTATGMIMGTPHYLSPEQIVGEDATPRSDLYSLGVVLYEMVTGELPYYAETPMGVLSQHVRGRLRPPKEANPNVPERVNEVCMRLLAREPENRYPDAAALIENLKRVLRCLDQGPSTVEVPDLAGLDHAEASTVLVSAGLSLGARNETPSERGLEGRIVGQEPTAGTKVERGSPVRLTISSGLRKKATVPDLTGQALAQARDTLAGANLSLGGQKQASSDTIPLGQIVGQAPEAGTEVQPNSPVSITISTGPAKTTVPDVSGRSLEEAGRVLQSAGLVLAAGSPIRRKSRERAGTVISTNPSARSEIALGTPVTPIVSSGSRSMAPWMIGGGLLAALALAGLVIVGLLVWGSSKGPSTPQDTGSSGTKSEGSSAPKDTKPAAAGGKEDAAREEELRQAVRDYYAAVDRQDWSYAYDNLDSQTKQKYAKDEYVQKNRYLASVDPLARSSPEITSKVSTSSPVEVTLNQTFTSGVTKSRVTYFVYEDGAWKHRFSQEDDAVFLPGTSYDGFVKAKKAGA